MTAELNDGTFVRTPSTPSTLSTRSTSSSTPQTSSSSNSATFIQQSAGDSSLRAPDNQVLSRVWQPIASSVWRLQDQLLQNKQVKRDVGNLQRTAESRSRCSMKDWSEVYCLENRSRSVCFLQKCACRRHSNCTNTTAVRCCCGIQSWYPAFLLLSKNKLISTHIVNSLAS